MLQVFGKTFKTFHELRRALPNERACIKFLEELLWNGVPVSPFDKTSQVYKCGHGRYKCKNTGKYFNVKTGTIFENTKVGLDIWFEAIYITTTGKGKSANSLAEDLDVTPKTAALMLKKIRIALGIDNNNVLDGEVEFDETYVGGKNKNRHKDKKVKNSQGRSYKDKTPVFGMIQRGGKLNAWVVPDVQAKTLTPIILKYVKNSAQLFTDEWTGYKELPKYYQHHEIVEHGKGQYVKDKAYTNTMEGAWNLLKKMINGIHHHVSSKHLQGYVNSWIFCYNERKSEAIEKFAYGIMFCGECKITCAEVVSGHGY